MLLVVSGWKRMQVQVESEWGCRQRFPLVCYSGGRGVYVLIKEFSSSEVAQLRLGIDLL